jgi:uncharacterized protein (DUF885 family)
VQPVTDRLTDLVAALLRDEYAADPLIATRAGQPGYDHLLPDLDAASITAREARDDAWLRRFQAVPDDELADPQDRADRDLVIAFLLGRRVTREWADWRRNPDHYTQPALFGVFQLFMHGLRSPAELTADAAARLRAAPALLAQGRANLDPEMASPLLVHRAINTARGGVAFGRELVADFVDDPALKDELRSAGEVAAAAYEDFVAFLEDLESRATGSWALGEVAYDGLLQQREGLSYGARELRRRGEQEYAGLEQEMRELTKTIAGHDDWHRLIDELVADAPPTPEAMRDEYAEWTARARDFLVERDLVTLPAGEECKVLPAPGFARATLPVAFYMEPPPLAKAPPIGHFFVPYPPDGSTAEEIQDRLRANCRFGIPTTSVHEAYPGHHWHMAHVAATLHRPVRSVFDSSYFIEGWALYVEKMMREQGFFTDPVHELGQVEARLFRAARMIVDTSLHLGEMSVDEATEFMTTHTAMPPETARAEVTRYCSWPTQAPSYLTGALEIERMANEWGGGLKDFHDRLAGSGGLPLGIAERLLRS